MIGTGLPRAVAKRLYNAACEPMRRRRRQMRAGMPKERLEMRHTAGGRLLPNRFALLETLPTGAVAAELGVADGSFSQKILEIAKPRKLHLVDAWHTARYAPDRARVEAMFADRCAEGSVEINRGLSTEVLAGFADNYLDWVYIDTNHSYETTAAELLECERVVRPGGRILGDDFCLGNIVKPVVFGVIPAVEEFCVKRGWQFEYLSLDHHGFFSFCLKELE